jgi:hypothetical protein
MTHAASDGAVFIPNGRKPLRMQSNFSELRFKMGATVYARIQINVQHVCYIMKCVNGIHWMGWFIWLGVVVITNA